MQTSIFRPGAFTQTIFVVMVLMLSLRGGIHLLLDLFKEWNVPLDEWYMPKLLVLLFLFWFIPALVFLRVTGFLPKFGKGKL
jgi:hypothetical protein